MQLRIPFIKNPFQGEKMQRLVLILAAVFFFVLGSVSTFYYLKTFQPPALPELNTTSQPDLSNIANTTPPASAGNADFGIFWRVWTQIQQNYVGRSQLDYQQMIYGAIKGMLSSLNDPYTNFFTSQENKEFQDEISGHFEGVGIEIAIKNNILTIVAPLEGTPARQAGLKSKDQIIAIDGKPTAGLDLNQAVDLIRGPQGSKVTLSILREDWDKPKDFEIQRNVINIPSASLEYKDNDIAVLKIYNFYEPSASEFQQKALQLLLSGRKKIILDLRNNPGGYFNLAVNFSGWFLPKNSVAVKEDTGAGPFVCADCRTDGPGVFKDYKIVVLIDGGSASAAEILAGALRDGLGVKLIGEQSFGKGSVQEVYDLDNNTSLKVTIAKWFTPNNTSIDSTGLKPDIEVKNDSNSFADPQLQKAIEVLNAM